jgi:hypothetical protein
MKWRKTNRAKLVDPSCKNHGSCPWCLRNRLHQAERAIPADEAQQRSEAEEKIHGR